MAAMREGARVLLDNDEGRVEHHPPFVLVCDCPGRETSSLLGRLGVFAGVVGSLVTLLGLFALIPRPIAIVGALWLLSGLVLWLVSVRRLAAFGRTRIDFEGMLVEHRPTRGATKRFPLDCQLHLLPAFDPNESRPDPDAPPAARWLVLRVQKNLGLRLGRACGADLQRVLLFFRQYGVPVQERGPSSP